MTKILAFATMLLIPALTMAAPASAQQRAQQPARPAAAPAGQGQALELGTFGEWAA